MKSKYNVGATIGRPHLTKPSLKYNQNGVTIIALVITIIVMLILTSVVITVGTGNIDNSRMMSFVAYMQTIQAKVDFITQNEDYTNYGEALSSSKKQLLENVLNSKNETFLTKIDSEYLRYFDSNHISSDLEVDDIEDEIVIDFNTREVISLNGIEYEDQMYYTQYNLPGGQVLKQQTEEVTRTVGFGDITSNIDGLNATFTIKNILLANGTLSYGKEYVEGEQTKIKWTTITNYTTTGNITTKNITESGTYYFKLVDNITGEDNIDDEGNYPSIELRLTNSPKLEENLTDLSTTYNYSDLNDSAKWAFATDKTDETNLVYYVWIPRFAYEIDSEGNIVKDENGKVNLEFLRGTSDITTSGGYINATEWTVPEVFTEGTSRQNRSMGTGRHTKPNAV